ncbi:MAG: ribulose-phosphate 3-epimerase [Planctomycetes bacterium]|nr:ribulose-phosphate 3-epimerase [Planctomycetota bacterium]
MRFLGELKQKVPTVSVGVLTADMMNLDTELELLESVGVKLLHFDIMDGQFWLTVGPSFVKSLRTPMLKDVHLLTVKPEDHIEAFAKAGADMITFAVETCGDVAQTLRQIGQMQNANDPERGILRGLSLNPETPVNVIKPVIDNVDIVLLLAVGPDTGRQNFLSEIPNKIAELKAIKEDILIFVDGAIKTNNIAEVVAMGPDVVVTGSAVFDGKSPRENARFMLEAVGKNNE